MFVLCIFSDSAICTWFKSMRTLCGRLKKKKSGQAVKAPTARQKWTTQNFQFLTGHLCFRTSHSQLGRVTVPELPKIPRGAMMEVMMMMMQAACPPAQPSTQPTSTSQPSQVPRDRRPRAAGGKDGGTGKRVYEAILKLVDRLSDNTTVQNRIKSAVQQGNSARVAFCQWMGLEMSKIDEELWTGFMREGFDLVTRYRQMQGQQLGPPPPPQQPLQQQFQGNVRPWSSPPSRQQSWPP